MKSIIIYGAGKVGKRYYSFFKSQHLEHRIYAFCDKNFEEIKSIDKIPVYSYNKLKDKGIPFIIAMVTKEDVIGRLQNDGQLYYDSIEEWAYNQGDTDIDRIQMGLQYYCFSKSGKGIKAKEMNLNRKISKMIFDLKLDDIVKWHDGYCPCCKKRTIFVSYDHWLREHYQCIFCGSIPRQRALMKVLETEALNWKNLKIHESSPSGTTFKILKSQCSKYTFSYYYEEKPLGISLGNNVTNQNLENLTFKDEAFDIFITQDVLEHINEPRRALTEINRVLKGGGIHVFTIPLSPFRKTRARIKMEGNERINILPPIYHGNPISTEGSLVTYDWGYDILEMISEITGMSSKIVEFPNSKENFECGLEGNGLEVIVSKKK